MAGQPAERATRGHFVGRQRGFFRAPMGFFNDYLSAWGFDWLRRRKPKPPPEPIPGEPPPAALLTLHNDVRSRAGLSPLERSEALESLSVAHAGWMAANDELSHTGAGRLGPFDRLLQAGYGFSGAAENTASGHQTPQDVTGSWMRSSDHRANILGRDFLEVGFGVAKSREGTRYWAALFARPSTLAAAEMAYCDAPEGIYA